VNLNHAVALGILIFYTALVTCACYLVWGRQTIEVVEAPAAPVWHDDGSLTAVRSPAAKPDLPETSAPEGGVLIRTVEVTVKPRPAAIHKSPINSQNSQNNDSTKGLIEPISAQECEPVKVRLDLREYREGPDLGLRVSVRAEGGEVLDSVDIPRDSIYMPRYTENVVGLSRIGDTTTLTYQRSFGALDIGPALSFPDGQRPTFGGALNFRF